MVNELKVNGGEIKYIWPLHICIGDDGYCKSANIIWPDRDWEDDKKPKDAYFRNYAMGTMFTENLHFAGNVNRMINIFVETQHIPALETLVIVNSDIVFAEGALDLMVKTSQKYNAMVGPGIVVPPNYVKDDHGPHIQMFSPIGYATRERYIQSNIQSITALSGCCFVVPLKWWMSVGGFDSNSFKAYFEDDDLGIRANIDEIPVLVNFDALVHHEVNQSIAEAHFDKNKTIQRSKKVFKAKWPEITWDSTGSYQIPEIGKNDRRIKRQFSKKEQSHS